MIGANRQMSIESADSAATQRIGNTGIDGGGERLRLKQGEGRGPQEGGKQQGPQEEEDADASGTASWSSSSRNQRDDRPGTSMTGVIEGNSIWFTQSDPDDTYSDDDDGSSSPGPSGMEVMDLRPSGPKAPDGFNAASLGSLASLTSRLMDETLDYSRLFPVAAGGGGDLPQHWDAAGARAEDLMRGCGVEGDGGSTASDTSSGTWGAIRRFPGRDEGSRVGAGDGDSDGSNVTNMSPLAANRRRHGLLTCRCTLAMMVLAALAALKRTATYLVDQEENEGFFFGWFLGWSEGQGPIAQRRTMAQSRGEVRYYTEDRGYFSRGEVYQQEYPPFSMDGGKAPAQQQGDRDQDDPEEQ